jgi:hypothetical protein
VIDDDEIPSLRPQASRNLLRVLRSFSQGAPLRFPAERVERVIQHTPCCHHASILHAIHLTHRARNLTIIRI